LAVFENLRAENATTYSETMRKIERERGFFELMVPTPEGWVQIVVRGSERGVQYVKDALGLQSQSQVEPNKEG
jgi:hypothetical protein